MLLVSWACLLKLRHLPGLSFLLSAPFPLACELDSVCCTLAGALCLLCLSRCSRLVKPIRRSAGRCVRCDSSHAMSRCNSMVFLRELAGTSCYCALCAYFLQLLLIFDIESMLPASAAVAACCLLVGGVRRLFVSRQVFPGGRVGR